MKNKILYIIGGKNFKFNTHIEKNSKVIFFDKYQEGFINQLFLIKEFAKNQNSLQNKWLEFQESVFKNIKLFIDRDEDYQYLLTNLFFEGSVYKTNSIYNFFKLYLIIDLIKNESIENITLIDVSKEIEDFFKINTNILKLSIKIIKFKKKEISISNIIKKYYTSSSLIYLLKKFRKSIKKNNYKNVQTNRVVFCQYVAGSQDFNSGFYSKYFHNVSTLLNQNYSWLFHGVGKISERNECNNLIKSRTNTYGFLNEYFSLNDLWRIIFNYYKIKKKLNKIKTKNIFTFEKINFYSLFSDDWAKSISSPLLDILFFEIKFTNFLKVNRNVKEILYLMEFQPWESMLNKVAKNFGVKTKGTTHINIRPNLMQYYNSKLIHSYLHLPTLVGVNSEFCKKIFLKSGFNIEELINIEAQRYNYLLDNDETFDKKKIYNKKIILIITSINPIETKEMLEVFSLTRSNVYFEKIYIKEHPSLPVNPIISSSIKDFPSYEVISGSMIDAFKYSDIVYTSNGSSTLLESVLCKKNTVTLLTLSSLPTPAFDKAPNLYFAYDKISLSEIFTKLIKDQNISNFNFNLKKDLYLNKNLHLWSKFLKI